MPTHTYAHHHRELMQRYSTPNVKRARTKSSIPWGFAYSRQARCLPHAFVPFRGMRMCKTRHLRAQMAARIVLRRQAATAAAAARLNVRVSRGRTTCWRFLASTRACALVTNNIGTMLRDRMAYIYVVCWPKGYKFSPEILGRCYRVCEIRKYLTSRVGDWHGCLRYLSAYLRHVP